MCCASWYHMVLYNNFYITMPFIIISSSSPAAAAAALVLLLVVVAVFYLCYQHIANCLCILSSILQTENRLEWKYVNVYSVLFCSVLFCSSRVLLDALVHTLTPFSPVSRQFLGFFPGDVHVFQVAFYDVRPVYPCRPGFLLYPFNSHCAVWSGKFWSPPFVGPS